MRPNEDNSTHGQDRDEYDRAIAIQMYTLRNYGTLEEQLALAASIGFKAIETVGQQGVGAPELNRHLQENDLHVIGSHVQLADLRTRRDEVIAFNRTVGNSFLVVPHLAEADRPQDSAGWQQLGEELGQLGARLRDEGFTLGYHNHDFELASFDGSPALDHLFAAALPEDLKWEADLAWVERGGLDPVELLEQHSARVWAVHAKDNAAPGENHDEAGFADVGYGVCDWDRLVAAARKAGARQFIVEHDKPADPARSVRRSFEFLRQKL